MELLFVPISLSQMRDAVRMAFDGDSKLLNEYHTSPGSLDHCVDNTMGFINENAGYYGDDIEFYTLVVGEENIGYTVMVRNDKGANELYSFGINIKYRTEDIRKMWLEELKKLLGVPFYIVLWTKNSRAINFFERNGFLVQRTSKYLNDETKTLIVCQQED